MPVKLLALQYYLRPLLLPFALCYGLLMRIRAFLYSRGIMPSWRPPQLCISVGNISWGGTGKTPLIAWLVEWALQHNITPAVLTRGYGVTPESLPCLVYSKNAAPRVGDEPLMLAKKYPQAYIVVDPVRARAGKWIHTKHSPSLYLLDDGLQHMAVQRDLNLVLLSPEDFEKEWNTPLPAGSWREGKFALTRADAFLVKAEPQYFHAISGQIRFRLAQLQKPIFSFAMQVLGLYHLVDNAPCVTMHEKPYLLLSGVGRPEQVEQTVRQYMGYAPKQHSVFADHHAFAQRDIQQIHTLADELDCEYILCTPKDAVKIAPLADKRFLTLDLGIRFGASIGTEKTFELWLAEQIKRQENTKTHQNTTR